MLLYKTQIVGWSCPDQLPYIWDYWSIIGRCKPYQLIDRWRKSMPRHSSLEWGRWDSSSSSYVRFHASIYNSNCWLIDFSQTNFRTFETTDPSLDDANHTNSWNNGVNPCRHIQAWNGVDGTPLAVVMSVLCSYTKRKLLANWFFPDQLPYIWDYWSIIGRCKPYQLVGRCQYATPRHSSVEWCRWDSSSSSCVRFHASIYNANWWLIDFSQTNFRTFETTDPSLDDANHTNS